MNTDPQPPGPNTQTHKLFVKLGIGLNALMLLLILLANSSVESMNGGFFDGNPFFIIGYLCCAVYFLSIPGLTLLFRFREKQHRFMSLELMALSLCAFSLSAYLLNFSMRLFSFFVEWAFWAIILVHVTLLYTLVRKHLPTWVRLLMSFIMGLTVIFSFLQLLYLGPIYHIGLIGIPFFGISLHVFVPLFIIIFLVVFYVRRMRNTRLEPIGFTAGISAALVVITIFLFQWKSAEENIHEAHASLITRPNNELPSWVIFSQNWPDDWFSQRILEGSMLYDEPLTSNSFDSRGNSFSEVEKHDPLVALALAVFDDVKISRDDRTKVLEAQFDARHNAHRKLWSGRNLITRDVLTNMQVFPDYRIAYVEKIITIKNNLKGRLWFAQQEALYTFHVPEGSVVSSLSLWIEGKEEKSRLTTKGKADSAYVAIVGRERRDPALLHWQEGNRITVTVFPCTPDEDRVFKVGFTIPLELRDDRLVLKNIYFEGPEITQALETTVIQVESESTEDWPLTGFELVGNNRYQRTGTYQPYWELEFNSTPLSQGAFSFEGKSYHLQESKEELVPFTGSKIYLDLNQAWSVEEIANVFQSFPQAEIYAIDDKPVRLSAPDDRLITEVLLKRRFSIFPFHKIEDPVSTLVITKAAAPSPNLDDLDGSLFQTRLKEFISEGQSAQVFLIGENWSPYLKTLKEFGVIEGCEGDMESLQTLAESHKFPIKRFGPREVTLGASMATILMDTLGDDKTSSIDGAPDHLMRLFNYNRILRQLGSDYFIADTYAEGGLLDLANAAYVASPISSLVVLETQKDYERFDIDENKNSLKNASTTSAGGVPEPHEWFLILLSIGVGLFLWFRNHKPAWIKA